MQGDSRTTTFQYCCPIGSKIPAARTEDLYECSTFPKGFCGLNCIIRLNNHSQSKVSNSQFIQRLVE